MIIDVNTLPKYISPSEKKNAVKINCQHCMEKWIGVAVAL